MMRWWKEVILAAGLSLKMLIKGKQTIILLAGSLILLNSMLLAMDSVKEEKSRICIGIADKDKTELSAAVIADMQQLDLYEIYTGEEEDLTAQLKNGELSAVCVIKKSFAKNVLRGKTNRLVTVYEAKEGDALLLGDILAGVMMEEICTAKGYQTLLSYEEKAGLEPEMTYEEYRAYVEKVFAEGGTEFSFAVEYIAASGEKTAKPSQSVVYEQAVFAIFALMTGVISLYAVLPFREFVYGTTAGRMRTLPVCKSALRAAAVP